MKTLTLETVLALAEDGGPREALQRFADHGLGIAVYENQDLCHRDVGRRQFLSYGGQNSTFHFAPQRAPDNADCGLGWRYILIGVLEPKAVPA